MLIKTNHIRVCIIGHTHAYLVFKSYDMNDKILVHDQPGLNQLMFADYHFHMYNTSLCWHES